VKLIKHGWRPFRVGLPPPIDIASAAAVAVAFDVSIDPIAELLEEGIDSIEISGQIGRCGAPPLSIRAVVHQIAGR
jgi:hypothetical protein